VNLEPPSALSELLREAPELRRAYFVGGCVRDALLDRPGKDFDLEVFGVTYEQLQTGLRRYGRVDVVGRSFGVAKLSLAGAVHDFSVPRRDSKTGPGHRGFAVEVNPDITPREAAMRRDFTLNALMYDPRSGELLDFFGGRRDLETRILRHTGPAFVEDPLRVLRGMQFAARFELRAAPETLTLCREIAGSYPELAVERVREEWFKWASRSVRPSAGLAFLSDAGWLPHFPELASLRGVPQEPAWHPEGDVFTHTAHALDALVELPEWRAADETTRIVWSLAVLTHDLGKAVCTQTVERDGRPRIVSPGHERESERLAASFLERLRTPKAIADRVLPLVGQHMAHFQEVTERAVRRLARRLQPETVASLCVVMTADSFGRPPLPRVVPEAVLALRRTAETLALVEAAPRPILLGRHLLALGLTPGPTVGRLAAAAFEAQLDGRFDSLAGAHRWLEAQEDLPDEVRARARLLGEGKSALPGAST
jgi:tRNA nucleotidyltransferase (CCA-adding enzyme)